MFGSAGDSVLAVPIKRISSDASPKGEARNVVKAAAADDAKHGVVLVIRHRGPSTGVPGVLSLIQIRPNLATRRHVLFGHHADTKQT